MTPKNQFNCMLLSITLATLSAYGVLLGSPGGDPVDKEQFWQLKFVDFAFDGGSLLFAIHDDSDKVHKYLLAVKPKSPRLKTKFGSFPEDDAVFLLSGSREFDETATIIVGGGKAAHTLAKRLNHKGSSLSAAMAKVLQGDASIVIWGADAEELIENGTLSELISADKDGGAPIVAEGSEFR